MENVEIPSGITTIGERVFFGCDGFTEITIPGSVKSIGQAAFDACANLERVDLQSGLTSIGERAFAWCKIATITIPDTVTDIGPGAFSNCADLTSATLSKNITSIGDETFSDCSKLADITIPAGVTSIGASAFLNCSALTSITIPAGVTSIGDQAFYNCSSLKDVTIESENVVIGTGNDVLLNFPAAEDADNDGVYELKTAKDLFWFAQQVNKGANTGIRAKLMNDIDLKDGTARGQGWSPIGSATNPYVGAFDGCGYSVSNLALTSETLDNQGLFGYVGELGAISNLGVSGTVTGNTAVGGVCGTNKGTITNCHSAATVTSTRSIGGGVCGMNEGTITNCYNTGAVSGSNLYMGGVCGESNGATVTNCYNTGAVSGKDYVGGVVGNNDAYDDRPRVLHCYNTGAVTGTGTSVGGVCGYNDLGTITACYYLTGTANTGVGTNFGASGDADAGEVKTAGEFASGEVAYLLQSGQSGQIWGQGLIGDTKDALPVLTGEGAKSVYKVTFQTNGGEHAVKYANPAGVGELPEAPAVDAGYAFYRWSQTNAADGPEFTAQTLVSSDMTVYAVQREKFGEESGEHTVTTTYGTAATLNLSTCVGYDGTPATVAADKFTYAINSGNDALGATVSGDTLSVPNTADAGSYTLSVTATEKEPQISLLLLDSPGTEPVTFTVSVTVEKAASSVTAEPTAIANLAYNGTAQALVNAGTATGGELQYSLTETDGYFADIPTGMDVGNYKVWYKVVGDANHNDTAAQSVSVTIAKGTPTYTVPANLTATYGQTLANVTLPTAENGVWAWSDSTQSVGNVGTNSFTATFTPTDTTNYNVVNNIAVTVKVDKATPTVTTWPTASAITYGDALSASTLTGGKASVGGTAVPGSFAWTNGSTKPAVSDSESTKYSVTFNPGDPSSYNTVTGQITLAVNKATPTATVNANTLTYNGAAQALVTGSATGGTLQYSLDGTNYSTTVPTGTNAGTYTVHYKVVGDANYSDLDAKSVNVTINQKALDGTVSISGTAAMNETLTAVYSDSDVTVDYQWYRDETEITEATGNSYKLTAADVGKTIKVTATGTGNYGGSLTSEATDAVTEALPEIIAWPTAGAITYGQALSDSAFTGGEAGVDGAFAWTTDSTKPTVADSGKAYSVTFTPSVEGYTSVTEDITVTVNPASLTIAGATLAAKTYDGTTAATVTGVTFDGLVNGETLELGTGYTATAAFNSANVNEANTATVTVTLNNANYALAVNTFDVTASITPKTLAANDLTVTVEPSNYEYTGSAITPTQVTVKHGETVIPATEYDLTYDNNTHVGTATVKITDKEGGNYAITGTATATFQITKLSLAADDVTVTLSETEYTYDGTAKEPTVTVTKAGATVSANEYGITYSNTNGDEGDHTNAGTVTVKVTAKDDGNYFGSNSATFTIKQKPITAVVIAADKHFDGTNTATVTATVNIGDLASGDNITIEGLTGTFNNANVGTDKVVTVNSSSATITGNENKNYALTIPATTTASIQRATVTIAWTAATQSVTYSGAPAEITAPTVTGENSVAVTVEPTYSYAKQGETTFQAGLPTDAGEYTVKASIKASDNLTDASADMTLTITAKQVTDPIITLSETAYEYDGAAKEPGVTVMDGNVKIASGEYTVEYSNNTNVGTATVKITDNNANGNYVITEKSVNFAITAASISGANVEIKGAYTYTGAAQTPAADNVTVTLGGKTLTAGTDYIVAVTDNINAGAGIVTVTGQGNYTGTATGSFTIAQAPLTITAKDQTVPYGDSIQTTADQVTATDLVNSDALASVTLTASGDKITPSKAVIVNADGSKIVTGNYQVTYTPGTLTYVKRMTDIALKDGLTGISYTYTGKPAANPAPENLTITGAQYGDVTFTWYAAASSADDPGEKLSGPPTAAGSYRVVCSIAETDEREGCELEIPVTVTKAGDFGKGYSVPIKEKTTGPVTVKLTELSCWPAVPGGTPAFNVESCTKNGLNKAEVDANGVLTLTPNGSGSAASGESTPVQDTVTVKVTGMGNYSDSTITISVSYTAKTPITITDVKAADAVYDGNSHAGFTGTPTAAGYNGGFSYVYTDTSSVTSTELPKKAGSYTLEISPVDAADFDGKLTLAFTINPKSLTWDASSLTAAKPADGSSAGAKVQGELKISGVVGQDKVELTYDKNSLTTPAFSGSAPHSEKVALTVSGAALTGPDAGNYVLPALGPEITATINAVAEEILPQQPGQGELKLTVESGLSEVPGNLGTTNYNTPAKIENALRSKFTSATSNVAVFDVSLKQKDLNGDWTDATTIPGGSLTVTLPYPVGTGKTGYTFTVWHMVSSGAKVGEMEKMEHELTDDGLKCTFDSFSPVAIGYQKTAKPNPTPTPSGGGNGGGGYFPGGGSGILPSNPTYAVTVQTPEHGSVTSGSVNASQGSTVTLTVTPDSGYALDTLTVSNSQGSALTLTDKGGGQYSFTMPSGAVTVTATFAPLPGGVQQPCDGGSDCPSHAFADLADAAGTWYHEAVDYVLRSGLMNGRGDGSFGPNLNLSRAQLAQILYNHAGRPTVGASSFIDVKGGAWYADSVAWAAETGVVTGYAGYFSPDDPITREQLAVMLWRYAGSPAATDRELHFADADEVSAWALDALRWAVENGIVNGKGGLLDPAGEATRAEAATMLMRYMRDTQE